MISICYSNKFKYICKKLHDMKIYTSYFANSKKLHKENIVVIGIALYPPKWFAGPSLKMVSPSYDILHNSKSQEDYEQRFSSEILAHRDPNVFLSNIESLAKGKDVALCCYEKPGDFCHRHLVAKWMNEKLGLQIEEFGVSKNPTYIQPSLF